MRWFEPSWPVGELRVLVHRIFSKRKGVCAHPREASLHHQVKAAAHSCDSHFQPLQRTETLSNCCGVLQLEFVTWWLVPSIYAGAYGVWEGTSGGCAV